jgi:hypothetical protein
MHHLIIRTEASYEILPALLRRIHSYEKLEIVLLYPLSEGVLENQDALSRKDLTMISLVEMHARTPNPETKQLIERLAEARNYVLWHRPNAKPFLVPALTGGFNVGIYDVALSLCKTRGLVVNTRGARAPQLIGEVCIPQSDFERDYAEKAWLSAANHINKLNTGA